MRPTFTLLSLALLLAAGLAPAGALPLDLEMSAGFDGTHKVVVIPMQFLDVKGVTPPESIQNLFFAEGGDERSVRDYFLEVSGGRMVLGGVVAPLWVTSEFMMAQYGNSENFGRDPFFDVLYPPVPSCAMALEAARLADPYVDYSKHVDPATGSVRIVVIHAGTPQDMGTTDLDIWSHMWSVCDIHWDWGPFWLDGVPLSQYMTDSEFSPIGTNAHELGHLSLGLPDLYLGSNPVRYWDLMASGSWDGDATSEPRDLHATYPGGTDPAHPGAYMKASLGWVAPLGVPAVPGGATYTLAAAEGTTGIRALRLDVETVNCWTQRPVENGHSLSWHRDGARFFLVELRDPEFGRYDGGRGPAGIIVWSIDECANNGWWWGSNSVATDPRVSVVGATRASIGAGEAFSPMSPWSSHMDGQRTGWFVEVQEVADGTATVRVGRSAADLRLITPVSGSSASTDRTSAALPEPYAHVDGRSASAAAPAVMTKDAPIRFFLEGAVAYWVVAEGPDPVTPTCVVTSAVTCRLPADTPEGDYVLRVRATDGATERRIDFPVRIV